MLFDYVRYFADAVFEFFRKTQSHTFMQWDVCNQAASVVHDSTYVVVVVVVVVVFGCLCFCGLARA